MFGHANQEKPKKSEKIVKDITYKVLLKTISFCTILTPVYHH